MAGPTGRGRRSTRRLRRAEDWTESLLDITSKLRTAACVPRLREVVRAWRAGGYEGITETTRRLFAYWFQSDHRLAGGARFAYHPAQREAVETLVFVWEKERIRSRADLVARYAPDVPVASRFASDAFARYAIKMATGSGKTKVIALAVAWQFLNARRESGERAAEYARTFLLVAPNVIVYERLRTDFAGGRIFEADPVVPRDMRTLWDLDCVSRGDGAGGHAEGALFLTNVQQLYDRPASSASSEPAPIAALLGPRAPASRVDPSNFRERIAQRGGPLLVLNDEAHHTHAEDGEWSAVIAALHERARVNAQLDFTATPRFRNGALFPWTIFDYPLKQAILDGVVKRPTRGDARATEAPSERASERYEGYLVAAVERWREYGRALRPLRAKPILFAMLASTRDADDVGEWLRARYPDDLGGERTLVIHTNAAGEVTKADLEKARALARTVDDEASEVRAIVSVLMLREGWDVRNVTVVLGLRPFSARARILPEQAIGRGLRLMFRGQPAAGYQERIDVIGNDKFLELVDGLEDLEEIALDRVDLASDRVAITTIAPLAARAAFDVALPVLSPGLVRKRSVAEQIAAIDVHRLELPDLASRLAAALEPEPAPRPCAAQEAIAACARRAAREARLPAQFGALAPKVRELFVERFFGGPVDLASPDVARVVASDAASRAAVHAFTKALRDVTVPPARAAAVSPPRALSSCAPFPWSRLVVEARRTVFNLVACDDELDRDFARFLDAAPDVDAFAKLPAQFGFAIEHLDDAGNLRMYHPDWVVRRDDGGLHLLGTRPVDGRAPAEVRQEDRAAIVWCENATALTDAAWSYQRTDLRAVRDLVPFRFADLAAPPPISRSASAP